MIGLHAPSSFTFLILQIFLAGSLCAQGKQSLDSLMWKQVKNCHTQFEDIDDDVIMDYSKVDDPANGYLHISGSWPTCGCGCNATVGAYKDLQGNYTLLQYESFNCNWSHNTRSNRDLTQVLPPGFGPETFGLGSTVKLPPFPFLFIRAEVPRTGTETRLYLELVPLGLIPPGNSAICHEYIEESGFKNCTWLYNLHDLIQDLDDTKFENLVSGKWALLPKDAQVAINEMIGEGFSRFSSPEALKGWLANLDLIYHAWQQVSGTEVVLTWDAAAARFTLKSVGVPPKKVSFRQFLLNATYWSPIC